MEIVAEAVCLRFERLEGFYVGLVSRRVRASRRKRYLHIMPRCLRGLLDRRRTAKNDQVRQRYFLPAGHRSIELSLDRFKFPQDLRQLRRLVDRPILLRCEANARAVCATALVRAA